MGLMRVTPPGTLVRTAKGTRIAQRPVPYQDIGATVWTPNRPGEGRVTETPTGRFCWGELLTTDPATAAVYISTPDAEACGMKARSLVGTQLNMLELPDVGPMAIIADP